MKKNRYTEEQIAYALRQAELGTPVVEVVRKMGVSEQTFYRWKKQSPESFEKSSRDHLTACNM